jgi:hypothetical protein
MERWLHRLGYAFEWMRDEIRGAAGLADPYDDEFGEYDDEHDSGHEGEFDEGFARRPDGGVRDSLADLVDGFGETMHPGDAQGMLRSALPLAASALGGWAVTKLLRPQAVNLPRAVLAGAIGTLLYDVVTLVDQRISGRSFDTVRPLGKALTDQEDLQSIAGWTAHYAGGIGLALVYARFVHGRLPGPALLQGAAFGAADALTVQWGGVLPLLNRLTPDAKLPAGYRGLASHPELSARSIARHALYGAALGALYRGK